MLDLQQDGFNQCSKGLRFEGWGKVRASNLLKFVTRFSWKSLADVKKRGSNASKVEFCKRWRSLIYEEFNRCSILSFFVEHFREVHQVIGKNSVTNLVSEQSQVNLPVVDLDIWISKVKFQNVFLFLLQPCWSKYLWLIELPVGFSV